MALLSGPSARVERFRLSLSPVVALLSSCLAVTAAVSVPDVHRSVLLLYVVDERWVGWAGLACVVAVGSGVLVGLVARRLGAAPGLAFGAAAAVFGLGLGDGVGNDIQVGLALVTLGMAFGALVVGGGLVVLGLPGRLQQWAAAGWALPLVAGWPLAAWMTLHGSHEERLALHPPVGLLAVVTGVLVLWASLSVLMLEYAEPRPGEVASLQSEPRPGEVASLQSEPRPGEDEGDWFAAWFVLVAVGVVPGLVLMMLGFDPDASVDWARPVSLLTAAVIAIGLGAIPRWLPHPVPQAAYLGIATVLALVPTALQLMLVTTDAGESRVTLIGVLALAATAVMGASVGYRRPYPTLPLALLVIAAGSAGAWVLPDAQWPMLAAGGFVAGGAGAALLAAVRMMAGHEAAWRFVTGTALVALLVGLAAQVPMAWVLGGSVADSVGDARAAGRIALGVLCVAAVMAATVTAILLDRVRPPRRHADAEAAVGR